MQLPYLYLCVCECKHMRYPSLRIGWGLGSGCACFSQVLYWFTVTFAPSQQEWFKLQFITDGCVCLCVCVCNTLIYPLKEKVTFWMYKVVINPKHFMGLSRFSARHKLIKSVKGELLSTPWFNFCFFFSSPYILISICLLPLAPLPWFLANFFLLFPPTLSSKTLPPLLSFPLLSSPQCFRLVLSSLYYVVAVGKSVCDSNLSCPIISCCSAAELWDGLLIFCKGKIYSEVECGLILSLI